MHINQEYEVGWANFYYQTILDYIPWILNGAEHSPYIQYGTFENKADLFSAKYSQLW